MSLFRGFLESDFGAFIPRKTRNRKYDSDRATVYEKLLHLKRQLDPLLDSREIRLRGSVSDYWIIPKRRPEIVCLWLRYPEPEGNYVIPHLEVTLWRKEVFIGLAIPKRGRIYQANLVNYLKKNGLVFVKSVTRLPSHDGTFRIEGGKNFFEGNPRSVALTHILDLARSYFPGTHWVHVGYSFERNDPRVASSKLAKLAASILCELYWLYGIVSKSARLGRARARSVAKLSSGISALRPFEKKRANSYSRRLASYEMDLRKKEKSNKAHRRMLNLLSATLEMQGYKCRDDPRSVDLVCDGRRGVPYLFEAKSCNKRSVRRQIRAGVAQLYEYRFFVLGQKSKLFLVTEIKPPNHFCDYLMNDRKIGVLWLEEASLKTTKRTAAWLHPIRLN